VGYNSDTDNIGLGSFD